MTRTGTSSRCSILSGTSTSRSAPRSSATPPAAPGHLLQRDPAPPRAPQHPHRFLGSAVRCARRPEPSSACTSARRRRCRRPLRRPAIDRDHAVVQQLDGVAGRLPLLGRARPVPRTEARLLGRPDRLDPYALGPTTRGSTTPPGPGRKRSRSRPRPTTAAGSSGASPTTSRPRVPGRGARTTSASRPTTRTPTTTWPFTRDSEVVRMIAPLTEGQRYKVLRGNAIKMLDLDRV